MTVGTVNNWASLGVVGRVDVEGLTVAGSTVAANQNTTGQARGILTGGVPATASAAGVAGTIAWEPGFLYVCVATNTWERVATATWV